MNNLSSYCGLVDAKIRASDEDLPVIGSKNGNVILVSWGNDMYEMLLILFKRAKPQKIFLFSSHLQKSSQIHCPSTFSLTRKVDRQLFCAISQNDTKKKKIWDLVKSNI